MPWHPIDAPAIAIPESGEPADGTSGGRRWRQRSAQFAILVLLLVGSVTCVIGSRPVYLGLDSIGHYVQVWFLHQSIELGHGFPESNPYLQGGHARAFPYGLVPYLMATFLYDELGDRAVSLLMAGVAICLVFIVWHTRLSRNLILTALFASSLPFLDGLMSFQFVFFWSSRRNTGRNSRRTSMNCSSAWFAPGRAA